MKKLKKAVNYFVESKNELLKVVWPDKKTTLNMTISVIIVSLIVALFLGIVDYGLMQGLAFILK